VLLEEFDVFCAKIPGLPGVETVISEARYGLGLIEPHLNFHANILEVGAGAGLLSGFLHQKGFNITAIEPGGFSNFDDISGEISSLSGSKLQRIGVEKLEATTQRFDLIYSIHVIEHLSDLEAAFETLDRLLSNGGTMVHASPNYAFPYEPHISRFFLPWAKPSYDVNFVTSFELSRVSKKLGLLVNFDHGVMADYAKRLTSDEVFRRRQARLGWASYLVPLLKLVPARFASPMVARFTKRI
jgi:2-polyprenyl-3-methyl-5-hydroxy-6-metoxy-1,4-benzoquinol methylase